MPFTVSISGVTVNIAAILLAILSTATATISGIMLIFPPVELPRGLVLEVFGVSLALSVTFLIGAPVVHRMTRPRREKRKPTANDETWTR